MQTTKRKLLAALPVGAVAVATRWERPIVERVLLPAHAQTTAPGTAPVAGTGIAADPRFQIRFDGATTADGISLDIEGGTECYRFGIRDTANLNGWEELFHDASSTGVSLDQVSNIGNVVLGSSTLFSSASGNDLTYIVRGCDSGNCWVWGHDPSTFSSEGCTVL